MTEYCTYLTVYRGNKLPPFYVGSTTTNNINNGYRGSVSSKKFREIWKIELQYNQHLFKTYILTYHPTRKEAFDQEEKFQKQLNVVSNPLYINMVLANKRPSFAGRKHTQETLKRKSEKSRGKKHTDETKQKISNIHKGKKLSDSHKTAISQHNKGKKHTDETKQKMKQARTDWWMSDKGEQSKQLLIERNKNRLRKPISEYHRSKISYGNSPNAKSISIDGITFASNKEAAEYLFPNMTSLKAQRKLIRLKRNKKVDFQEVNSS